jgi:DNA repair protein SbcC/Rad50
MKQYPRIFSLSTVGVIYHNNCDYLLHPLRTDFTGGSGSGKSVIADLLQLIFVAKKEFWESGTDVMTTEKRTVEGIVLKQGGEQGNFGYAFVNIEVSEGKFIVVGTHVQTNARSIYPFIIQKGFDFGSESENNLDPMEQFLLYRDFLPNNQILPIDKLKEILEKRGFNLRHFNNRTAEFHRTLYNNQILSTDFSHDEKKLKTFAQIIQSFARGKGVGAKSEDLKNFLFANDDDQNKEYEKRKKEIEEAHEEYKRRARVYETVKLKKDRLLALLEDKKKRDKAQQRAFFLETGWAYQQKDVVGRDLIRTQKETAHVNLQQIMLERRVNELNMEAVERELDSIVAERERLATEMENRKKQREFAEKNRASYEKAYGIAQQEYDETSARWSKVKSVEGWLRGYKTIDAVRDQFNKQDKIARERQKLEEFENFLDERKITLEFVDSTWAQDYRLAQAEYDGVMDQLETEIHRLEQLLPLFDSGNKDSVIQWAIRNAGKLTKEEESLLMHFKALSTKKPGAAEEGMRFIPDPENIYKNLQPVDKSADGFWVNLSGVMEYVPLVAKQLFNNPKTIEQELKKYGDTIGKELEKLTGERDQHRRLRDHLVEFGFNQQVSEIYLRREELVKFVADDSIAMSKEEFEMTVDLYTNPQNNLRLQYEEAKKNWEDALQKLREADDIITNSQGGIHAIDAQIRQLDLTQLPDKERELKNFKQEKKTLDERFADWEKDVMTYLRAQEGEQSEVKVNQEIRAIEKEHGSSTKMLYNAFSQRLQEISRKQGSLEQRLIGLMEQMPSLESRFTEAHKKYTELIGEFKPEDLAEQVEESQVNKAKVTVITTQKSFESNFDQILREEKFDIDDERLKGNHMYDFQTLAEVMLPSIVKDPARVEEDLASDIEEHLRIINQKMNEINDHKLKIINGIFSKIEEVYSEYRDRIEDMREFFRTNKISGGHYVEINFDPSKSYPISWIRNLNKEIAAKAQNVGLFKMFETDNEGADAIILKAFLAHSDGKNVKPDIKKLTNPKSYFDLSISLKTPKGEDAPGSNGQNYTMLALLCIARLSIIDSDRLSRKDRKVKRGVRFMTIDEVAGLGENFDMLYDLAKNYDYQILTMTIDPIGRFEEGKQNIYTLRKNNNPEFHNINPTPLAQFSYDQIVEHLGEYITSLQTQN